MNHDNKQMDEVKSAPAQNAEPPKASQSKEEAPFEPLHVNRKFAISVIAIFVAVLILPTLAWGVLKVISIGNPELMETINFDTGEQRNMAKFPETFDPQTFTSEVESWYNDNLPFRSVLYKTQENMANALERPFDNPGGLRERLIKLFHGDAAQGNTPGGDVIEDIFNTESATEIPTETETLPEFESEDDGPSDCQHLYAEESVTVQEPTCSEWGIIGYPCTQCDYVGKKEYTQKLSHEYVSNVTEFPLCGTNYEETLTCSVCNETKTQILAKKHVLGEQLAVVEPSYTSYGYTLARCKDCLTEYRTNLSNKLYDTSYFPPIYRGSQVTEGRNQWLFYRPNDSEAYYMGTNLADEATLLQYASILQQLNNICKEKGITLQICVWPNKDQVYPEYMPTMTVATEYKRMERIVDYISKNTDVKMIYPINELLAAKPYFDMYLKYDTHWNCAGGFVGYQAMLKSLGLETTSIHDCPVYEYTGTETQNKDPYYTQVWGDMISIGGLNKNDYTIDHNYYIKYRPQVVVDTRVGGNGAGDTRHSTSSNAPNDLNFVMLADSFRVMQLGYLEKDFTDCFLTSRSSVNNADVVAAVKEADILVIAAVERNETNILGTAQALIGILSN
ncbi:MAG: hypothetical protein IJY39_10475 [Clostridia bacterium]|nr:hypothetical protein [Clostridia bacterium]